MNETTSSPETATGPVTTAATPPPPQPPAAPPPPPPPAKPSRVTHAAAWVGIVAGVVFVVAVIFGTGFVLGAHSGGHHGWRGGDGDRDMAIIHRGGPPPMFPMGPRGEFERQMPPFGGPGGPGFQLPQPPSGPSAPSTTAPRP